MYARQSAFSERLTVFKLAANKKISAGPNTASPHPKSGY
jgi:hypothetical protein